MVFYVHWQQIRDTSHHRPKAVIKDAVWKMFSDKVILNFYAYFMFMCILLGILCVKNK